MKEQVVDAVRRLRAGLKETQPDFAKRTGTAVRTISRWESNRPPSGQFLVHLEQIARENGLLEEADTFNSALSAELGFKAGGVVNAGPTIAPESENDHRILARIIANPQRFTKEAKAWARIRTAVIRDETKSNAEVVALSSLDEEIWRRAQIGESDEQIAKALSLTVERIKLPAHHAREMHRLSRNLGPESR